MIVIIVFVLFGLQCSEGVIYHLNDTEYNRMPPVYDLDNYDQCMQNEDDIYCTAKALLFSDTPNELMTLITEYSAQIYKHYNHSVIEHGVCVTQKCRKFLKSNKKHTESNIDEPLANCINETIWNKYRLQTNLLEFNCVTQNEKMTMDIYDYIFMYFILILFLLNVVGTVCDTLVRKQYLETDNHSLINYLTCFSITQNWKWLVSYEPEDPRLRKLRPIYATKSLLMYMFIMGHTYYNFHAFIGNTHTFEKLYETINYKLLFNGMMSVQILLCISGFLLVYHLLIESEKTDITWRMIPKWVILRLWRLTPANLTCVIFSATLLRHWGDGPLWKTYVTNKVSGYCRKYWWSHLLFVNNYIPDNRFCFIQSWHLSADFQLFVVGLCVFVATKANRRVLVLSSVALLGMLSLAVHIWWNDLEAFVIMSPEFYRTFDSANHDLRKFGHVNLPGFVIGMLTGHYVYKLQKDNADFTKYKPFLAPLCNLMLLSIIGILYTGSYFYEDRTPLPIRILYGIVLDPTMALITSFGIFAVVFRFNDFLSNIFEKDVWLIPGRLTYSVSLIHTFFLSDPLGCRRYLAHVSIMNHIIISNGIAALSYMFAIPFFIMVEAPFNRLLKVIFSKNIQPVKKAE